MTRARRRVVLAVVGLAALAGGALLLRPSPILVETTPASRGDLTVTVEGTGQTRVRDRFSIVAPVAGRLERLNLRAGDNVRANAVLARILPGPLDARMREQLNARVAAAEDAQRAADALRTAAEAAWQQARRNAARARELATSGLASPETREQADLEETSRRRDYESADFRAQAATHDVEAARAALLSGMGYALTVRAPVSGQVLRVSDPSARVVNAGDELLELGDPRRLEVVVDLLSADAVRVRPGDGMLLSGWGGDSVVTARVRLIEPSGFTKISALGVEEQRVNVIGDLLEDVPALGDRYRVEVRVVIWTGRGVLQVPAGAVFRSGDGWGVFLVQGGRVQTREIRLGHRTPAAVEVLAGLAAGDLVVRDPSDRITDGVRVRPRPGAPWEKR